MVTPTANAVPSQDPIDLLFNAEALDTIVNSSVLQYTDRLGIPRLTAAGAIARIAGINVRGAWTTATAYAAKDIVSNSGTWYIALDAHTSGATFAGDLSAHWRVYQGVTSADLSDAVTSTKGPALVAFGLAVAYSSGNIGWAVQQMLGTRSFQLFVSSTGSDSNDGLSAGTPFKTLQKALDQLMALGTVGGTRRITLAAGTWSGTDARARLGPLNETEAAPNDDPYQTNGVNSVNYIIIEGPDPGYLPASAPQPTPTAIFSGGGAAAVGLAIEGPIKLLVKNIKFTNFNGSASSGGIIGNGALLRTENVHTDGCFYGVSNTRGRLEVKGGLHANVPTGGAGVRSIFGCKHEIGNQAAGAAGQGPFFSNCDTGILAQEGATGHADYCTFTGCNLGIDCTTNARVNYSGAVFTSCGVGVRTIDAYAFASSATFTSCGENKVTQMHGIDGPRMNYGNSALAMAYLSAPFTHTGNTNSTPVLTMSLGQGDFCPNLNSIRKPQHIDFWAYGTKAGTAGTKQYKLRIGSTLVGSVTVSASETGNWECSGRIVITDSNVQSGFIRHQGHNVVGLVNSATAAEDNAAGALTLGFELQLGNAGDSIVVNNAGFIVWG